MSDLEELELASDALGQSLGEAAGMAAGFDAELRRVRVSFAEAGHDVRALQSGLSKGLRRAVDSVVLDGGKLSGALDAVAQSMIDTAYAAAVKPVSDHFGGAIARGVGGLMGRLFAFEQGGSFAQGRVMPFADGGVVSSPVTFPMRGGATGLMGEAGPEAIMPLARGPDGKLGVRAAQGAAPVQVVMNITTPDAESFRRSRSQIAAQMSRALTRGNRNR